MEYSDSINWRRGFNRLFAIAWFVWALWLFVGIPVWMVNERLDTAKDLKSLNWEFPALSKGEKERRRIELDEFRRSANLPEVYRQTIIPEFHLFLLATIVPPIILYMAILFLVRIFNWVRSGFAGLA